MIDFGLNMLATGRVEPTIRISVVSQPLNFPVLIGCELAFKLNEMFVITVLNRFLRDFW